MIKQILTSSLLGVVLLFANIEATPPKSIQINLTLTIAPHSVSIPSDLITEEMAYILGPFCEENNVRIYNYGDIIEFEGTGWVVLSIEDFILYDGELIPEIR